MSTEHDEHLSSLYKETGQDMPAAHIDAGILAAARRETASRPRPAYSPFSGSWRIPAALAAVLVLSFGLVNLMDNEPIPVNGYEPFAMEEAEMMQPSLQMADTGIIKEEQRTTAESPPVATADFTEPGINQGLLAKQAPEKKRNEQVARKKKQEPLIGATDQISAPPAKPLSVPALAENTTPVPGVDAITALRIAGRLQQANQAADAFIRQHFGDELENIDTAQVTLAIADWKKLIAELRKLERKQQANKLEKLINNHLDSLGR